MKYYKHLILIAFLALNSCNNEPKKDLSNSQKNTSNQKEYTGKGFLIHGYTTNNNDSIYLKNSKNTIIAKTISNEKGYFSITGNQTDTIPVQLISKNKKINILLCDEEIFISQRKGVQSEFQKEYSVFKSQLNNITALDKTLLKKIKQYILNDKSTAKYKTAIAKQQYKEVAFLKEYIKNNPKSYSALIALQELEERVNLDLDSYSKIKNNIANDLLNTAIAQNLEEYFIAKEEGSTTETPKKNNTTTVVKSTKTVRKTITKDRAKAFYLEGTSINGFKVTLPAVVRKSKLVYLDFWASWCGPCRMQNPVLKGVYKKYHKQGFEIISISADTDENAWRNAVNIDGLPWINVLDKNKTISSRYYVQNLPFGVLIDRNGMVIADYVSAGKLKTLVPKYINEK